MIYVTFHSHYGAILFKKEMKKRGVEATLMPVPRFLSSSCGTCARLADDAVIPDPLPACEIEGVHRV